MTGIHVAESVLSGKPEATTLRGRYTTHRDLFTKQYRGVRVADIISDLHLPMLKHFSDEARKAGQLFDMAMRAQGFEPMQPPEGLKVWGPYQPRNADAYRSQGQRTVGFSGGEDPNPDAADFIVEGIFIAPRGHLITTEGV